MRVQDLMTRAPKVCAAGANLAEAAGELWTTSCGALPVVDDKHHLVGIITDRDICISVGTRNRRPSEIVVSDVMTRKVATCHPNDEIHSALETMRSHKVRRLPVVALDGTVEGILSISELLLRARHDDGTAPEFSDTDVMSTLLGIYVHCPPYCKCA